MFSNCMFQSLIKSISKGFVCVLEMKDFQSRRRLVYSKVTCFSHPHVASRDVQLFTLKQCAREPTRFYLCAIKYINKESNHSRDAGFVPSIVWAAVALTFDPHPPLPPHRAWL